MSSPSLHGALKNLLQISNQLLIDFIWFFPFFFNIIIWFVLSTAVLSLALGGSSSPFSSIGGVFFLGSNFGRGDWSCRNCVLAIREWKIATPKWVDGRRRWANCTSAIWRRKRTRRRCGNCFKRAASETSARSWSNGAAMPLSIAQNRAPSIEPLRNSTVSFPFFHIIFLFSFDFQFNQNSPLPVGEGRKREFYFSKKKETVTTQMGKE